MTNMLNQSTGLPRLTKTKGFILASLIAGAMALPFLLSAPKASAGPPPYARINVTVRDRNAAPISGLAVHLYEGATGKCQCLSGQCDIAPDATATTDNSGKANFTRLMKNTVYTVCITQFGTIEKCSGPSPCVDPSQCSFSGSCRTVTTQPGFTNVTFGGP
jgi:hypothetical protein